jgi:hypothetical protein
MPPLKLTSCKLAITLAGAFGAGAVHAELLKVSPFLSPQAAANAPAQNAPLEYRGSMQIADVEQFRIVDPARKVGTWLKVGEHDANLDVVLKQYDSSHDTLTVDHGGQSLTLQLKVPKVVSSGSAAPMLPPPPMAMPSPNVSPAVIQSVVPNPTPADEQRRLEAVAAEVARRRALREQAAQQVQMQSQQPQPPQPNVSRADLIQAQQQMRR